MKVLTITVESSVTKNLGNYQSTKQQVTMTVEINQEVNPEGGIEQLRENWQYVTDELFTQMVRQLQVGETALEESKEKAF